MNPPKGEAHANSWRTNEFEWHIVDEMRSPDRRRHEQQGLPTEVGRTGLKSSRIDKAEIAESEVAAIGGGVEHQLRP
ncbi:hypothetical protein PGC08_14875 [Brevibacterium sp. BDJS002]|uniref:hypothetical protein n=1 Tax=Brevibacterium sp. BDJS002 TaxID=3020906 RepID=UPI00230724B3|nr:hypothetical protein [Brevibacterium sp. BDJS002]WCE39271.1 hypothetical protein PGC08_14875 [Brevibacterium sp. BDJS002]